MTLPKLLTFLSKINLENTNQSANSRDLNNKRNILRELLGNLRAEYRMTIVQSILECQEDCFSEDIKQFWNLVDSSALDLSHALIPDILSILSSSILYKSFENALTSFNHLWESVEKDVLSKLLVLMKLNNDYKAYFLAEAKKAVRQGYLEYHGRKVFDYIVDYPDSQDKIEYMKACLVPGTLNFVANSLCDSITERLINSVVLVEDALLHLILSISVLIHVDRTGFILSKYFHQIRPYIRCQPGGLLKTIELFMNLIEDPEYSESFFEIKEIEIDGTLEQIPVAIEDSFIFDPIEAGNKPICDCFKSGNVFRILSNFFDSTDEFVYHYSMKMKNFILNTNDRVDQIRQLSRELEMLRAKVKSAQWSKCLVMLKDLEISKSAFQDESTLVTSRFYWPKQTETEHFTIQQLSKYREDFLNEKYQSIEESFIKAFPQMILMDLPELTKIDLEIIMNDSKVFVTCNEIEALILFHVQSHSKITFERMLEHFDGNISSNDLEQAIKFWKGKGILWQKGEECIVRDTPHEQEYIDMEVRGKNINKISQTKIPDIVPFIYKVLKKHQKVKESQLFEVIRPFACCNKSSCDSWVKLQINELVKSCWLNYQDEFYVMNRMKLPLLMTKGISL